MTLELKIGTRSSRLARIQAELASTLFQEKFPDLKWGLTHLSSPGDRDKAADLLTEPDDFFTRDLDEALDGRGIRRGSNAVPEGFRVRAAVER